MLAVAQLYQGHRAAGIGSLERSMRASLSSQPGHSCKQGRDHFALLARAYEDDPRRASAVARFRNAAAWNDATAANFVPLPRNRDETYVPRPIDERLFLGMTADGERGPGFVIESVAPGSMVAAAGLRPNDVVVHIHGRALTADTDLIDLLDDLLTERTLAVGIVRGGVAVDAALVPRTVAEHHADIRSLLVRADRTYRDGDPRTAGRLFGEQQQ